MSFFHKSKLKKIFKHFSFPSFLLGVLLTSVLFSLATVILIPKNHSISYANQDHNKEKTASLLIKPISAAEIYPEFICGCCGKPLDPNNICCGDMKQKIAYIDSLVDLGLSKDEIIFKAAKEFGMESLAKAQTKQEIKDKLAAQAPKDAPKIAIEQTSQDMGRVSQAEGIASTIFSLKNDGKSDLVIDKLSTSCGCTSASIIYQGKEGPTFTMPGHGKKNPTDWSVAIAPGEQAQLKVYYDPNAHGPQKKEVMQITRTISIFSNDPVEFEKKVKIELEQVK
jgi:hypothetical protein